MKQKTCLDEDRRRALAVVADNPDGCTRAVMLARGFPLARLNRLVRAGLVISHIEYEERGDTTIEIVRVQIARQAICQPVVVVSFGTCTGAGGHRPP